MTANLRPAIASRPEGKTASTYLCIKEKGHGDEADDGTLLRLLPLLLPEPSPPLSSPPSSSPPIPSRFEYSAAANSSLKTLLNLFFGVSDWIQYRRPVARGTCGILSKSPTQENKDKGKKRRKFCGVSEKDPYWRRLVGADLPCGLSPEEGSCWWYRRPVVLRLSWRNGWFVPLFPGLVSPGSHLYIFFVSWVIQILV